MFRVAAALLLGFSLAACAKKTGVAIVVEKEHIDAREANELTGFVIGGIPPFGHERRLRVVMDPDLGRFTTVWAAAGLPNVVFPIAPASLRLLADAHVAPIAQTEEAAIPQAS